MADSKIKVIVGLVNLRRRRNLLIENYLLWLVAP